MKIYLSRGYILSFVVAIISIYLWVIGAVHYYGIKNAATLNTLVSEDINDGKYVQGELTRYEGKMVEDLGRGHFTGVSETYLELPWKEWDYYTIPMRDENFISYLIYHSDTKDKLECYRNGEGAGVKILGKIIELPVEISYDFLKGVFQKDNSKEISEIVNPTYGIKEVDYSKEIEGIYAGPALLLTAFLIFIDCGGLKGFIVIDKPLYYNKA